MYIEAINISGQLLLVMFYFGFFFFNKYYHITGLHAEEKSQHIQRLDFRH